MRELSIVSSSESSDNIETQTVWRFSKLSVTDRLWGIQPEKTGKSSEPHLRSLRVGHPVRYIHT